MTTIETSCIVTPVAKKYNPNKPCSLRDYEEQLRRCNDGKGMMWDDAKGNPTRKVGGLFCFVHNDKKVQVHLVTNIHPPSERAPSWSNNVGQGDRNVLMLSSPIATISWDIWHAPEQLGITSWRERGTRRVADADRVIALMHHLRFPQYESETGEVIFK